MTDTQSILAELEDLGATGDKPVEVQKVEEARVQKSSPAPVLLDERGTKMVRLADIVIGELDNLIVSASTMRDALSEMRDIWQPAVEEAAVEEAADAHEEPQEDEHEVSEPVSEEAEYEVEEVSEELQGTPSAMGHISLTVPAPVPLPPGIADLKG